MTKVRTPTIDTEIAHLKQQWWNHFQSHIGYGTAQLIIRKCQILQMSPKLLIEHIHDKYTPMRQMIDMLNNKTPRPRKTIKHSFNQWRKQAIRKTPHVTTTQALIDGPFEQFTLMNHEERYETRSENVGIAQDTNR